MAESKGLSAEEAVLLRNLSSDELRKLNDIRLDGPTYQALATLINTVIDAEKNYAFALQPTPNLPALHAFSRGKASFGVTLLRLLYATGAEMGRRSKLQEELKKKKHE